MHAVELKIVFIPAANDCFAKQCKIQKIIF